MQAPGTRTVLTYEDLCVKIDSLLDYWRRHYPAQHALFMQNLKAKKASLFNDTGLSKEGTMMVKFSVPAKIEWVLALALGGLDSDGQPIYYEWKNDPTVLKAFCERARAFCFNQSLPKIDPDLRTSLE